LQVRFFSVGATTDLSTPSRSFFTGFRGGRLAGKEAVGAGRGAGDELVTAVGELKDALLELVGAGDELEEEDFAGELLPAAGR
jgi:hypothetical protein